MGAKEWRNIQTVVRSAFVSLFALVDEQQRRIVDLEEQIRSDRAHGVHRDELGELRAAVQELSLRVDGKADADAMSSARTEAVEEARRACRSQQMAIDDVRRQMATLVGGCAAVPPGGRD